MDKYISMVKYDQNGKPIDVAYGSYKEIDVQMFRDNGFVNVEEDLVKKIDLELAEELQI